MIFIKRSIPYLIFFFLVASKNIFPQDYITTTYTTTNGLENSKVFDVLQDESGKMWFATAAGICTYDGSEWYYFKEDSNYKKTSYVRLKQDSKGYIWALPELSTYPIEYFDKYQWHQIAMPLQNKKSVYYLHTFDVKNDSKDIELLIAIIRRDVLFYKNNTWQFINNIKGYNRDTIYNIEYNNKNFYISTESGLLIFNGKEFDNSLNLKLNITNTPIFKTKIFTKYGQPSNERIWLLSRRWIGYIDHDNLVKVKKGFDITQGYEHFYYNLTLDSKNNIYFGNESVLYFLNRNTNQIRPINTEDIGLTTNGASAVIQDYEYNIWISSFRGINKIRKTPFKNFDESAGFIEDEVTAISQFNNGEMIFGHNDGLSIKLKNKVKSNYFAENSRSKQISRVLDICKDKNNHIWFTSTLNGLGEISDDFGKVKWYRLNDTNTVYFSTYISQNNKVLLGTKHALYYLSGNKFKKIFDLPYSNVFIRKIYQKKDGTFLFGTAYGLLTLKNGKLRNHETKNFKGNDIFAIYSDDKLGVLIGTIDGLYTLKKDSLVKCSSIMINNPVYFITHDKDNNIWFGTDNGVMRWDGFNIRSYNTSDGLAGNEANRAAGFIDKQGRLWIGTDRGVSVYNKNDDYPYEIKPKISLLYFEDAHNEKFSTDAEHSLSFDHNNIIFHYRGYSFINEDKIVYKVLITNFNNDFKEEFLTKENFVRFNNLPPGKYKFLVSVKNEKGIWSNTIKSASIIIEKPFYNQFWFYALSVFLFGFIIYTVQDYYSQRKYSSKLEKEVIKRTNLLRKSERKYKTLVNTSADGILIIDETGKIDYVNKEALNLLGQENYNDLQGKDIFSFIKKDQIEKAKSNFQKNILTGIGNHIEFTFIKSNGQSFPAEINSAVLTKPNDGPKDYVLIIRDVTIYKQAQETLKNANIELEKRVKEKTSELSSLIEQSPLGIVVFNTKGIITEYNYSFKEIFGIVDDSKILNYNIFNDNYLIRNNYYLNLKNIFENGGSLLTKALHISKLDNSLYQNNESKWLKFRYYSIQNHNEKVQNVIGIIDDVTEQYRLEEISKKLIRNRARTSAILETTENERKRISMDLHDGLGQILTTAKLKLEIFKLKNKYSNEFINEALELILKAGREISNIVHNLHPIEIDKYGLIASLELLCEKIEKSGKIKINFINDYCEPIENKKIEIEIFRIVQESLNNIAKHAEAKSAQIKIRSSENNEMIIEIEDDGKGFNFNENQDHKKNGFGLLNMIERSELIGGKIHIDSKKNRGTIVNIKIPLGVKI